jgi:hypothetical protein
MVRSVSLSLLLLAAMALTPISQAWAFSTESGGVNSDGSSQIADPDEALDQIADPGSGTGGDATIDLPNTGLYNSPSSTSDSQMQVPPPSAPGAGGN